MSTTEELIKLAALFESFGAHYGPGDLDHNDYLQGRSDAYGWCAQTCRERAEAAKVNQA